MKTFFRKILGKLLKTKNPEDLAALKKLLTYVRPHWFRMGLGVALGLVAAVFNALMLLSFNIIFSIVLRGSTPMKDMSMPVPFLGVVKLNDWFPAGEDGQATVSTVLLCCSLIPLMIFCRGMLTYFSTRVHTKAASLILYNIRNDLYSAVLRQSMNFFGKVKSGEVIQVVFTQSGMLQANALLLVQAITRHPSVILSTLFVLFTIDPLFTFLSLFVFPLCIIPVRMIAKQMRRSGRVETEAGTQMLVSMQEAVAGIRLVKGNSREDYELARFEKGNRVASIDTQRHNRLSDLSSTIVETVASLSLAGGLAYWWYQDRTAAQFVILVASLISTYPPVKELSKIGITVQRTLAACEAVFDILERKPEVQDRPDARDIGRARGAIALRDVTFSYTGQDGQKLEKPALENVSCEFEPGKFYALVGPSGSGKSTLFSLLTRFYDVDSGSIQIDGSDLRDVTQASLRRNLGIVSQDVFLFHDTIEENIRYGRLDATPEEIRRAAEKAHVDAFVRELPDGYGTIVGDGGSKVSGGQKQRISIARTILKNAPVLLLDEATSALDTESERIIQEAIHDMSEGRTVIAIAHRLSTVLAADRIIVMQNGRIEAIGTNEELLRTSPLYQKLHSLQFGAEGANDSALARGHE
ncbi:MAG: lipid export permease/ATP-binding protein MsbA [Verrucomicrobiota bacterium]